MAVGGGMHSSDSGKGSRLEALNPARTYLPSFSSTVRDCSVLMTKVLVLCVVPCTHERGRRKTEAVIFSRSLHNSHSSPAPFALFSYAVNSYLACQPYFQDDAGSSSTRQQRQRKLFACVGSDF